MRKIDFRLRPPYRSFTEVDGMWNVVEDRGETSPPRSIRELSMEALLAEMDDANIEHAVALGRQVPKLDDASPHSGGSRGHVAIDDLIDLQDESDGRFVCFAGINPNDPDAIEKIDRAIVDGDLYGVSVDPGKLVPPRHVHDESFHPVLERCEELGVPISLTMSYVALPDSSYCRPSRIERLADEFRELDIIISHGAYPWTPQIAGLRYLYDNIWLCPDIYINRPFPGRTGMVEAMEGVMQDRFVWASAYPFWPIEDSVEGFEEVELSEETRSRVYYENAAELLGL